MFFPTQQTEETVPKANCKLVSNIMLVLHRSFSMGKTCKKAKWLSGEALQTAGKRREVKSKGEKERYKQLNAEFQRIVRRDKKAFLSDQCKEIEEKNRMGKTRDLLNKLEIRREHFMQRRAQ